MHEQFMRLALAQAAQSGSDVPVGAVIVRDGQVIASAHNEREAQDSPLAHAEMLAMERACRACGIYHFIHSDPRRNTNPVRIHGRLGRIDKIAVRIPVFRCFVGTRLKFRCVFDVVRIEIPCIDFILIVRS